MYVITKYVKKEASKTSLIFKLLVVDRTLAEPVTTVEHTNVNKICHVCFGFSDPEV